MSESGFYLAFSCAPGIGPKRFLEALKHFKTAEKAWNASQDELAKLGIGEKTFQKFDEFRKEFDIEKYQEKLEKARVTFIPQNSKQYPESLLKIPDRPIGLFIKGNISLLCHAELDSESHLLPKGIPDQVRNEIKTIAVVGTRKITSYGREVTESLVAELVMQNFVIVSGLAMGVDATAHKAALENNGRTIAVLGCGVDCCTPRENERLYEEILDTGNLIISEYPLGQLPNKGTFPARNRIIAALSAGVLVTEAGVDSGSLITAEYARRYGKPVFAVPGPITSSQSKGTTYLLKSGVKLVTSGQDILEELGTTSSGKNSSFDISMFQGSSEEKKILLLLQDEALSMDELSKKTTIPITKLSILLSGLELKDVVKNQNNVFSLK